MTTYVAPEFPASMVTPSTQLHLKQFPLRGIQKLDEWLLHFGDRPISKWVGKAEIHSLYKCWHSTMQLGGSPQLLASLRGAKGLNHTCRVPTLKLLPEGKAPKSPSSDSQQGWFTNPTRLQKPKKQLLMRTWTLNSAIAPGLNTAGAGENAHHPVFPWKRTDCIL